MESLLWTYVKENPNRRITESLTRRVSLTFQSITIGNVYATGMLVSNNTKAKRPFKVEVRYRDGITYRIKPITCDVGSREGVGDVSNNM